MNLKHLFAIDDLSENQLRELLAHAQALLPYAQGGVEQRNRLLGKTVCNLFFEPSTRTRSSFQLAAQRCGADVLNFDVSNSSGKKGETAIDTMRNLEAMGVDAFVVRTAIDGEVNQLQALANPNTRFINAGDGCSNHPTQALLDMLSIQQQKGADFSPLKVVITGDILHSRVARSNIHALKLLGCGEIGICAPENLMPEAAELQGCQTYTDFNQAIQNADVVMMLRVQHERMQNNLIRSVDEYHQHFGLNEARLGYAAKNALVMHPGPMNRGVEISDAVADGAQSIILQQVRNGVAVRMAVLQAVLAP